jgi:hypothetical protein
LLKEAALLTAQERQTWQALPGPDPQAPQDAATQPQPKPTCRCPKCGATLILAGSWRAGQKPPTPTRERAP